MDESEFLKVIVIELENQGLNKNQYRFSLDDDLLDLMNVDRRKQLDSDDLEELIHKCLANEYVQRNQLSKDLVNLSITTQGFGVGKSTILTEKKKAKRTLLKVLSDFIEDHKGGLALITLIIGLITFYLKFFREE